jgi:hypothetical protein
MKLTGMDARVKQSADNMESVTEFGLIRREMGLQGLQLEVTFTLELASTELPLKLDTDPHKALAQIAQAITQTRR